MNKEELAPHVEEIKKALGNTVSDEIIAKELNEYVNIFQVPLENAKRSVLMKHGNDNMGFVTGENVVKKIGDLTGTEQSVDIIAKVVFSTKKTIPGKNGERTIIRSEERRVGKEC